MGNMALTREEKIEKIRLLEEKAIREERARIIPKLAFLYQPMRYKVARGGRGAGKSWEYARALLKLAVKRPLRILCTREVQKSIKDSVHKLLSDQIERMGYGDKYQILENEIRGTNGTLFIFAGLHDQTVESIKSFEGIDICWCEEAQAITKRSWSVLIPTIRKDGSEIWISYNPELESDETHQRFTINPPDDCISVLINYDDNPCFPEVLEKERIRCKRDDPDGYENIWEGKCKPAVVGAIYYKEVARAEEAGQICNLPYDPMLKVHIVMDIGWNDSLSVAFVQKIRSEVRIIDYIEDDHLTLDQLSADMKDKRYNWGKVWLPHDGFSGDLKSGGKSVYDLMKKLGWDVATRDEITEMDVEPGIKITRMMFGQLYIDRKKCERLIECLKRYRRRVNNSTQEESTPLHDEFSHGADCARYICINAENMRNEKTGSKLDLTGVFFR